MKSKLFTVQSKLAQSLRFFQQSAWPLQLSRSKPFPKGHTTRPSPPLEQMYGRKTRTPQKCSHNLKSTLSSLCQQATSWGWTPLCTPPASKHRTQHPSATLKALLPVQIQRWEKQISELPWRRLSIWSQKLNPNQTKPKTETTQKQKPTEQDLSGFV